MSKHTPGPWEVKEVRGQKFVAAPPYPGHPYHGCTTCIEILSDEDYPTRDADVELIAAAPDLLEALQRLGAHGSNCMGGISGKRKCTCGLDAAIAKATGGQS